MSFRPRRALPLHGQGQPEARRGRQAPGKGPQGLRPGRQARPSPGGASHAAGRDPTWIWAITKAPWPTATRRWRPIPNWPRPTLPGPAANASWARSTVPSRDCDSAIHLDENLIEAYVIRAKARLEKASEMRTLAEVAGMRTGGGRLPDGDRPVEESSRAMRKA